MNTQNDPSKHHYLPAFYLRQWEAGEKSKLIEFSKPYGPKLQIKPVKALSTGYVERLYSIEGYPEDLAQKVETWWFAPVDHEASMALKLLKETGEISRSDSENRSAWCRFLLSLLLRCPEDIKDLKVLWRENVFGHGGGDYQAEYSAARTEDYPESFSDFLRELPVEIKEYHQYKSLMELMNSERVGTEIVNLDWTVISTSERAQSFLTSDRPIVRSNGSDLSFVIPIGPRQLFVAASRTRLARIKETEETRLAKQVNQFVVEGAMRFVYSCDTRQSRFICNRLGTNPQPRLMQGIIEAYRSSSQFR